MQVVFPFLAVAALVIVVPGQDTALTIRNTLGGGRRAGVATAGGVSCGQAIWAIATTLGLAALLVASEPVYLALRALGAAYLVWLGASCLWRALRGSGKLAASATAAPHLSAGAAFRQGIISNLGNPKMAVFFTSLLPQFTPAHASFAIPLTLRARLLPAHTRLAHAVRVRDLRCLGRFRPTAGATPARCVDRHRPRRTRVAPVQGGTPRELEARGRCWRPP